MNPGEVDWSQLPTDVSRMIYKQAISGPGSYDYERNYRGWLAQNYVGDQVNPFHVDRYSDQKADDVRPTQASRWRYTGVLAGAAASAATGAVRAWWQPTKAQSPNMKDHVPHQTKSSQPQTLITPS